MSQHSQCDACFPIILGWVLRSAPVTLATTFIWQISLLYFLLIPTLTFQLVDSLSNSLNGSTLQNSLLNHSMILIGLELILHQHVIEAQVRAIH